MLQYTVWHPPSFGNWSTELSTSSNPKRSGSMIPPEIQKALAEACMTFLGANVEGGDVVGAPDVGLAVLGTTEVGAGVAAVGA